MTQGTYQPEERARRYRELSERAVSLAREGQWAEAVDTNRELLGVFPRDLSTLNRLGKALSEIGHYSEAKKVYQEALDQDPTNNIARKNLERLAMLADKQTGNGRHAAERINPQLFIEETGKTGFTNLVDVAPRDVIARLSAGDQVTLNPQGNVLYVMNAAGERIGRVEPRLANRLIKFIQGGNRYEAAISDLTDTEVRLIIRETFQHQSQFGKVSFPATATGTGETFRAYIKDTMLRHEADEEDEYGEEGEFLEEAEEEESEESGETEFEESDFREE